MFFELEVALCERFPALSPFSIRKQRAREVFLLIRRLSDYNDYKKKTTNAKGQRIIRRKAGDTWF